MAESERSLSRDRTWMQVVIHLLLAAFCIGVGAYAAGTIPLVEAGGGEQGRDVAVLWSLVVVNTVLGVVQFALACRKAGMGGTRSP